MGEQSRRSKVEKELSVVGIVKKRAREEDVKEVRAWLWTGRQTLVTHWRDVDSLR